MSSAFEQNPDLRTGLMAMDASQPERVKAKQYYDGTATEIFSTDILRRVLGRNQMEFVFSYSRQVVTSRLSRMKIQSITSSDEGANEALSQICKYNRIDREIHAALEGALVYGEAYLSVWPDEDGNIDIFYNSPETVRAFYDPENPRKKLYVIKRWNEENHTRVNLYYRDRVEKYITSGDQTSANAGANFVPFIDAEDGSWPIPNETGRIPVFHITTTGRDYGRPEHHDSYGPQNALNKLLAVQISGIDYLSFPQRYILQDPSATDGVPDFEHDFGDTAVYDDDDDFATSRLKSGPGGIWNLKGIKEVGQFEAADPRLFTEPFKEYVDALATVTNTPLHLFQIGSLPSGQALRAAEAPLNKRVEELEGVLGDDISDALMFALELLGYANPEVEIQWAPPATYDDKDLWDTVAAKHDVGVPTRDALIEAGYTPEQVEKWFPSDTENGDLAMAPHNLELLGTAMQRIATAVSLGLISADEGRKMLPKALIGDDPAPQDPNLTKAIDAAKAQAMKPQPILGE